MKLKWPRTPEDLTLWSLTRLATTAHTSEEASRKEQYLGRLRLLRFVRY